MTTHRVPLSRTEEAFVAMVAEEYAAALHNAEQLKRERLRVLREDKGIAPETNIRLEGRTATSPAFFEYDTPDIAPPEGPPAPEAQRSSEKSTAPESATGA